MKKENIAVLVASLLLIVLVGTITTGWYVNLKRWRTAEDPIARSIGAPKTPYTACYYETTGVTADTAYLLVDLSGATDWPHTATNEIILKTVAVQGEVSGAHHWRLAVGVIVENDATDGTAVWVTDAHLESLTGIFDRNHRHFAEGGLNLRAAGSALTYGVANGHSELTAWQNDTAITATVGTTGTVAAGDLVILADEITDGSTLSFSVCVDYDTE